jgi:hypothetical protein
MSNISSSNITDMRTSTSPSLPPSVLLILAIIVSVGLLGSLIILLLRVFSKNLPGDFKYFVGNVAFIGVIAETCYLAYGLCMQIYPDQNYPLILNFVIIVALFGNYLSSVMILIPNTISRFVLFSSVDGEATYEKYFKKRIIFIYFLIVDCYGYVIVFVGAIIPSSAVVATNVYKFIFSLSFFLCYFIVFIFSVKMSKIVKKSFSNTRGMSVRDAKLRQDVVRAFQFQACVPLVFQIPQLVTQILQMLAILFNMNLNANPYLTIGTVFGFVNYCVAPLTPIADVVIVFYALKPYRRAFQSTLFALLPFMENVQSERSLSILQTSRRRAMNIPVQVG